MTTEQEISLKFHTVQLLSSLIDTLSNREGKSVKLQREYDLFQNEMHNLLFSVFHFGYVCFWRIIQLMYSDFLLVETSNYRQFRSTYLSALSTVVVKAPGSIATKYSEKVSHQIRLKFSIGCK